MASASSSATSRVIADRCISGPNPRWGKSRKHENMLQIVAAATISTPWMVHGRRAIVELGTAGESAVKDGELRAPAEVALGDGRGELGVEGLAGEHVDVAAAGKLVGVDGQRAGLDELHR